MWIASVGIANGLPLATRNVTTRTSSSITDSSWSRADLKPTGGAMQLRIPDGNVQVTLAAFEAVWTRAERLFRDNQSSRYLGGVCAACRWVAGHPEAVSPLQGLALAATPELILREDVLATMTYLGPPGGDPAVDADWAAGVAMTLGWTRGVLPDSPLPEG
jgi:hypothetical protein